MDQFEELQQKQIDLDLSDVPRDQRSAIKEEIGQFVVDQILEKLGGGESPVEGERFKALDKDYAARMKGGNRTPNLELEGDMLASLGFRNTSNGIAVGIMAKSERPKADGHNNFSGDSKIPQRRFIPGGDQDFKSDIQSGIDDIIQSAIEDAKSSEEDQQQPTGEPNANITDRGRTSVTFGNLFSKESISSILLRKLNGR